MRPEELTDARAGVPRGRSAGAGRVRAAGRRAPGRGEVPPEPAAAGAPGRHRGAAGGRDRRRHSWPGRSRQASDAAREADAAAVAADAKRLAASALNVEYPDLALLTAVEATQLEQSPETYGALLTLLSRQPDVVTRFRTPERFLYNAASPDGRTVFVGENEPVLRALDARDRGAAVGERDLDGQVGRYRALPGRPGRGRDCVFEERPTHAVVHASTPDGHGVHSMWMRGHAGTTGPSLLGLYRSGLDRRRAARLRQRHATSSSADASWSCGGSRAAWPRRAGQLVQAHRAGRDGRVERQQLRGPAEAP